MKISLFDNALYIPLFQSVIFIIITVLLIKIRSRFINRIEYSDTCLLSQSRILIETIITILIAIAHLTLGCLLFTILPHLSKILPLCVIAIIICQTLFTIKDVIKEHEFHNLVVDNNLNKLFLFEAKLSYRNRFIKALGKIGTEKAIDKLIDICHYELDDWNNGNAEKELNHILLNLSNGSVKIKKKIESAFKLREKLIVQKEEQNKREREEYIETRRRHLEWKREYLRKQRKFSCSRCHGTVSRGTYKCPHCGIELLGANWKCIKCGNINSYAINDLTCGKCRANNPDNQFDI